MVVYIVNIHGNTRDVPKEIAVLANDAAVDHSFGFFEMPSRESTQALVGWAKSKGITYSVSEKKDVSDEF